MKIDNDLGCYCLDENIDFEDKKDREELVDNIKFLASSNNDEEIGKIIIAIYNEGKIRHYNEDDLTLIKY